MSEAVEALLISLSYGDLEELKEKMEGVEGDSLSFSDVIDYLLAQEFK